MTIQIPNVGTGAPADQTGDSPWLAMKKVAANFSDQSHAASRLVGTDDGKIPSAESVYQAAFTRTPIDYYNDIIVGANCDTIAAGTRAVVDNTRCLNAPPGTFGTNYWNIETSRMEDRVAGNLRQIAYGLTTSHMCVRVRFSGTWRPWDLVIASAITYDTTTAAGANVVVSPVGKLMRSTSSEQYKEILAPLEIDEEIYGKAMALKPIIYRSTAGADNPLHHYFSFSAEQLGALDKAFTLWRYTEQVTDEEGNTVEQPLAEPQAEGLNINAILAFGHAISINQDKLIKNLQEQINALKPQPEI